MFQFKVSLLRCPHAFLQLRYLFLRLRICLQDACGGKCHTQHCKTSYKAEALLDPHTSSDTPFGFLSGDTGETAASLVAFALGGVVGGGGGGVLGGPLFTFGEDGPDFRFGLGRSRCSRRFSSSSFLRAETLSHATLLGPIKSLLRLPGVVFERGNSLLQGLVCGVRAQRRMRNFVLASLNMPVTACKLLLQLAEVQAELCTGHTPRNT
jgi:hypothetical protein